MRILQSIIVVAGLTLAMTACSTAQSTQKSDASGKVAQWIENRKYVFEVQTVLPMSGRTLQMGGQGYDLVILEDTVRSWLPYFGRAFQAPMNPTDPPMQFVSTDFEYSQNTNKSGGWDIVIKPKDARDIQQMNLTVSQEGYASLQVLSNNRQPISYNGIVVEKQERKKKRK